MSEKQDAKTYLYREISTAWDKVDVDHDKVIGKAQFFQYFDKHVVPNPNITDRKIAIIEEKAAIAFSGGDLLRKSEWKNRNDFGKIEVPIKAVDKATQVKREFVEPAVRDAYETAGRLGNQLNKQLDKAPDKARDMDKDKNGGVSIDEALDAAANWLYGSNPKDLPTKGEEKRR